MESIVKLYKELKQEKTDKISKTLLISCMGVKYEKFQILDFKNQKENDKQFLLLAEDQYKALKDSINEEKIGYYKGHSPLYSRKEWLEIQKLLDSNVLAGYIETNMKVFHFNAPNDHKIYLELYAEFLSDIIGANEKSSFTSNYYYIKSPNKSEYSVIKGKFPNILSCDHHATVDKY